MTNEYSNPYKGLDPDDENISARINATVAREDFNFIRRIRTDGGTISTTVNLLFKKLIDKLHAYGITDYTRVRDFERLVADCDLVPPADLVLRGGPTDVRGSSSEANAPHDQGGTLRARRQNAGRTHGPSGNAQHDRDKTRKGRTKVEIRTF